MLPSTMASRYPALFLSTAALLVTAPAGAERVDRVVSVLGERVVTTSDLALEQVLSVRDPSLVPALSRADLLALEDQRRIRGYAGDVRLYQPGRRALDARQAALRRSFQAPGEWEAFLEDWGLTEEVVQALLLNRLVVETTVLRTLGVPTPETEDAWLARYDAWLVSLREGQAPHRPATLE